MVKDVRNHPAAALGIAVTGDPVQTVSGLHQHLSCHGVGDGQVPALQIQLLGRQRVVPGNQTKGGLVVKAGQAKISAGPLVHAGHHKPVDGFANQTATGVQLVAVAVAALGPQTVLRQAVGRQVVAISHLPERVGVLKDLRFQQLAHQVVTVAGFQSRSAVGVVHLHQHSVGVVAKAALVAQSVLQRFHLTASVEGRREVGIATRQVSIGAI